MVRKSRERCVYLLTTRVETEGKAHKRGPSSHRVPLPWPDSAPGHRVTSIGQRAERREEGPRSDLNGKV